MNSAVLDVGRAWRKRDQWVIGLEVDGLTHIEDAGNNLTCMIAIANGTYTVTLLFAEVWFGPAGCAGGGGVGSRVFNIYLEGNSVETDVDIYAEGGCVASGDTNSNPIAKEYTVTVSDGELRIGLQAVSGGPLISAISVE